MYMLNSPYAGQHDPQQLHDATLWHEAYWHLHHPCIPDKSRELRTRGLQARNRAQSLSSAALVTWTRGPTASFWCTSHCYSLK